MSNVLFGILLVGVLALAEAVYYLVRYRAERRAEELKQRLQAVGDPAAGVHILRRRRLSSSKWLNDAMAGVSPFERLERLLEQADAELSVARLIAYSIAFALLGLIAGTLLGQVLVGAVLAPLLGLLPVLTVWRTRSRRSREISEQLPNVLEMMARAVRAGHALSSSFKLVAQEAPLPIAVEFAKAYEQQNLGLSFESAVMAMTERVPGNLDLRLFAVSVMIQKETGGNMVEVLENIAATMRERFKFYSKLRALTAEGRLSGLILGALPFVVALLISLTNPSYLRELGHGTGRMILVGGMASWVTGVLWMRSLLKVEY